MNGTTPSSLGPQPTASGSGRKKFIFITIIILILAGLVFGGTTYLRGRQEEIITPTPLPTPEPSATPAPETTPSATPKAGAKATATPTKKPTPTGPEATPTKGLTIRVLNGSGEVGKAGTAADFLKGLGYGIAGTGNADNYDYEKSTITIKKDKESLLATLKKDLESKYQVGTTSATLASSSSYDAEVIIGKQ